jgi:hypothetical protein
MWKAGVALVALLVFAMAMSGCGVVSRILSDPDEPSPPVATPGAGAPSLSSTGSMEPSPPVPASAEGGSDSPQADLPEVRPAGGVHEPKVGSKERTALMDAARRATGVTSKFEVLALSSDGAWASGILRPLSDKKRRYVAWRNERAGGWTAFWVARSGDGALERIAEADSRFPMALAKLIPWNDAPPSKSDVAAAIVREVKKTGDIGIASVEHIVMTRDSKGRWWGAGVAMPVRSERYDPVAVYVYRVEGTWRLHVMGTGVTPDELPRDVRELLR